jgi:DNA-directed RNA polymerase subunit RPC12/RpoP
MRKLSAGEGSEHLELSEQQEHSSEVHSIQYDVWLDDKTGEKKVEKYMAHEHAERCDECGYYTMMVNREEIVKQPNLQESGLLVKHYRCSYCKHREARQVMLAALSTNVTPSS